MKKTFKACLLIVILFAYALASLASAQDRAIVPTTQPIEQRIISLNSIAAPYNDPAQDYVDPELLRIGWVDYAEKNLWPQYELGVRRFALWNPMAMGPGATLVFDQYDRAKLRGARHPSHYGFQTAITALTRQTNVEVIVYLRRPSALGMSPQQFTDYCERNLAPFIKAGCSIGWDATPELEDTGYEFLFLCSLESRRIKTYGEGYPETKRPGWAQRRTFLMPQNLAQAELMFGKVQPEWYPQRITAETIVILQQPSDGVWQDGWQRRDAKPYLDKGYSVNVQLRESLLRSGKSVQRMFQ